MSAALKDLVGVGDWTGFGNLVDCGIVGAFAGTFILILLSKSVPPRLKRSVQQRAESQGFRILAGGAFDA
jgi:hypothetical protein